eukprot:1532446-Pyramimonas_sp.AAC.1
MDQSYLPQSAGSSESEKAAAASTPRQRSTCWLRDWSAVGSLEGGMERGKRAAVAKSASEREKAATADGRRQYTSTGLSNRGCALNWGVRKSRTSSIWREASTNNGSVSSIRPAAPRLNPQAMAAMLTSAAAAAILYIPAVCSGGIRGA